MADYSDGYAGAATTPAKEKEGCERPAMDNHIPL
jgi:hypothetical protein